MTEKTLSEKIEVVGFHTEVVFKDKDGNKKIVDATKGEAGVKVKDLKEAIKRLKEEWRIKIQRMEIISGEVAVFELENIINKIFGEELCK